MNNPKNGPKPITPLPRHLVEKAVREALAEDLGLAGDITTDPIIPDDAHGAAAIVIRAPARVAGLDLAEEAFRALDANVIFTRLINDGCTAEAGTAIARLEGSTRALLTGERTALNFLGRLCGIATLTAAYVAAVDGTGTRIADTRKTTPGLRGLEKYAVRCGGGVNHRFGLYDAVLVKDNHIAAAGGIGAALSHLRARGGHMVKVEVEVDTLDQLREALTFPIDAVLLDNMDLPTLKEAVALAQGKVLMEASGGVTMETVGEIAKTGVDLISVGALTHSPRNLDSSLEWER
jgi:nicotinate-nucleotide pyrophosphorylase (carboxylating)